jgi:glycosyltransferase involved in cell wall biosynthesis
MNALNIAIIGSRGIPNYYGGFEQMAQYLAVGLLNKGHEVTVYNSHLHPYQEKEWHGVKLIHCYDAEDKIGTAGQFVYDFNCIMNARRNKYDVMLFLGYTSSSVWGRLFPKNSVIISNMDGMEWKRDKYSKPVQRFLRYAEKLAVKYSQYFIADSTVIQSYVDKKYNVTSKYIPYGAEIFANKNEAVLAKYGVVKTSYHMLMARMEPENNIDMILQGFHMSNSEKKFIVIGNINNSYGKLIYKKYCNDERIRFVGGIFDAEITNTLRAFCRLYFHGHTVGGTNPSLLEAMANGSIIVAHDNEFNRAVLKEDAYYFKTPEEVMQHVMKSNGHKESAKMVENNFVKIEEQYNWPNIVNMYEEFIIDCYNRSKK